MTGLGTQAIRILDSSADPLWEPRWDRRRRVFDRRDSLLRDKTWERVDEYLVHERRSDAEVIP